VARLQAGCRAAGAVAGLNAKPCLPWLYRKCMSVRMQEVQAEQRRQADCKAYAGCACLQCRMHMHARACKRSKPSGAAGRSKMCMLVVHADSAAC